MHRLAIRAALLIVVAAPASAAETITYTYDALGRLVKVVHSGTINNGQQTTYAQDAADNRMNVAITGASR